MSELSMSEVSSDAEHGSHAKRDKSSKKEKLCEYEKQRLLNIKNNNAELERLGLAKNYFKKPKKESKMRKCRQVSCDATMNTEMRRSTRIANNEVEYDERDLEKVVDMYDRPKPRSKTCDKPRRKPHCNVTTQELRELAEKVAHEAIYNQPNVQNLEQQIEHEVLQFASDKRKQKFWNVLLPQMKVKVRQEVSQRVQLGMQSFGGQSAGPSPIVAASGKEKVPCPVCGKSFVKTQQGTVHGHKCTGTQPQSFPFPWS